METSVCGEEPIGARGRGLAGPLGEAKGEREARVRGRGALLLEDRARARPVIGQSSRAGPGGTRKRPERAEAGSGVRGARWRLVAGRGRFGGELVGRLCEPGMGLFRRGAVPV